MLHAHCLVKGATAHRLRLRRVQPPMTGAERLVAAK